jgi:hypothetical protein
VCPATGSKTPPLSKEGVKKNLQYPANFSMKSTVCFSALGCAADAFKRSAKELLNQAFPATEFSQEHFKFVTIYK